MQITVLLLTCLRTRTHICMRVHTHPNSRFRCTHAHTCTRRLQGRVSWMRRLLFYMCHTSHCVHAQVGGKGFKEDEAPNSIMWFYVHYIIFARTYRSEGKVSRKMRHPIILYTLYNIKYYIPYYTRAHTQVGGKDFLEDETPNYIIHIVYIRDYISYHPHQKFFDSEIVTPWTPFRLTRTTKSKLSVLLGLYRNESAGVDIRWVSVDAFDNRWVSKSFSYGTRWQP